MKKAILVALVAMVASSASAALLLYEGFDYAAPDPAPRNMYIDTSLTGQGAAGGGWTGGWIAGWSTSMGLTDANPLSYGALLTSGNSAVSQKVIARNNQRNFNTGLFNTADGNEYWISYLVNFDNPADQVNANNWAGVKLGSADLWFGKNYNQMNWGMELPGGTQSTTAITAGTHLVVAMFRYEAGTMDKFMWIDPSTSSLNGANLTTGSATLAVQDTAKNAPAFLYLDNTLNLQVDEIRVATNYADVTPIPEPASILLLVGGLVGAYKLRRRK